MASVAVRFFGLVEHIFLYVCLVCALQSGDSGTAGDTLTADTIVKLGTRLNKPLLVLMGKAFGDYDHSIKRLFMNVSEESKKEKDIIVQVICRLHRCAEWTSWTACDGSAVKLEFGGQNRTRTCGLKSSLCPGVSPQRTEYETRLCQGHCPDDYNMTTNQFCLKVTYSVKTNRTDAVDACKANGGNLANIDSLKKQNDIEAVLSVAGITAGTFWIDGTRTTDAGSWSFASPMVATDYSKWLSGEPSNRTGELCKVLEYHKGWYWCDRECHYSTYNYICEIH